MKFRLLLGGSLRFPLCFIRAVHSSAARCFPACGRGCPLSLCGERRLFRALAPALSVRLRLPLPLLLLPLSRRLLGRGHPVLAPAMFILAVDQPALIKIRRPVLLLGHSALILCPCGIRPGPELLPARRPRLPRHGLLHRPAYFPPQLLPQNRPLPPQQLLCPVCRRGKRRFLQCPLPAAAQRVRQQNTAAAPCRRRLWDRCRKTGALLPPLGLPASRRRRRRHAADRLQAAAGRGLPRHPDGVAPTDCAGLDVDLLCPLPLLPPNDPLQELLHSAGVLLFFPLLLLPQPLLLLPQGFQKQRHIQIDIDAALPARLLLRSILQQLQRHRPPEAQPAL